MNQSIALALLATIGVQALSLNQDPNMMAQSFDDDEF